ncbi:hypothetical protein ACHMW6_22975 [Pseudoduganella sp. UC29_106]|uniref:hypothetical protein n=1 Tax=Pseudoduganella sp. UC29_106 TaxID=3374553 RepID=UPI0037573A19
MNEAVNPMKSKAGVVAASIAACCFLCCSLLAASALAAGDPPNNPPAQKERNSRDYRDSRWGDARDPRSFEARAEEQRRMMEESSNNAEMNRRIGRMTPDERRDLRRQINEAGQEVYALPPRR